MTDKEKKIFMNSFLKSVEIYEDERCDGRILKSLGFRFPIFSEDGEIVGASWDNESSIESVVLLSLCPLEQVLALYSTLFVFISYSFDYVVHDITTSPLLMK